MSTVKERYAPLIENIPYLSLPLKNNSPITEGYIYSNFETSVHGLYFHKVIDYSCKYGTPVYASADGYAIAGYHRYPLLNEDATPMLYQGLPISNGLGYFIQIYHPYSVCKVKGGRITQYGHLSKFAKGSRIKTFRPLKIDFEYEIKRKNRKRKIYRKSDIKLEKDIQNTREIIKQYPWVKKLYGYSFREDEKKREMYTYSIKEIKDMYKKGYRYIKYVKQGDLIGYTGSSALIWGDLKYKENCRRPNVKQFDTWDDIHLHFEEASRDTKTFIKKDQRDPYGIYLGSEHYKNIKNETLFIEQRQRRLW